MSTTVTRAKPFLKWAGGKARSARQLTMWAPQFTGTYWEPFMGSAAVFFELEPNQGVLSDANEELVICFQEIASEPFGVMEILDGMPNTREHYHLVRAQEPNGLSSAERAARVIYLNKTGFRGLWRVNRSGQFNVPYGEYSRPLYNRDSILRASKALGSAEVLVADYGRALELASTGDWVYLDPPYVPDRKWGDFRRYTSAQFNDDDHFRIAELMRIADARGVYLMLTNSVTAPVRAAYDGFRMTQLATRRDIHLTATERASKDLVITNYEPPTLFQPDEG